MTTTLPRPSLLAALAVLTFSGAALAQDDPLDDLPEPPPSTAGEPIERPDDPADDLPDDPLDDLPEAPGAEEAEGDDLPEAAPPEDDLPEADPPEDDPLDDLPEAAPSDDPLDDLSDVPDQAPPPDGGLLDIVFTGEIDEMRLKGPDGKYYTPGRLQSGRYVLGIRYEEKEDWVRFTFDLAEGRETRIDCDVSTRECGVRSRVWKP